MNCEFDSKNEMMCV